MTLPDRRLESKLYYERNKEKIRQRMRLYYKEHPIEVWAHNTFFTETRARRIERRPCEICGNPKADAHHDDHSEPLRVRWLCRSHHVLLHAKQRQEQIA